MRDYRYFSLFLLMAKFKPVITFYFMCPGCDEIHALNDTWKFNGDYNRPTVDPSVLVHRPPNPNAAEGFEKYKQESRCHSFIKDGMIQFLDDCTHNLKGQTVELPDIE